MFGDGSSLGQDIEKASNFPTQTFLGEFQSWEAPGKPPWLRQILRMWLNMGCPRDQRSLRALPCLGAESDSWPGAKKSPVYYRRSIYKVMMIYHFFGATLRGPRN